MSNLLVRFYNNYYIWFLLILATPTIDPDYIIPSINYALIGSNVTLSCSYPIGVLTQYYTVIWYIGSSVIDPNDPHYGILPNLSLSINNVLLNDNSDGYYCEVSVHEPNNDMIYSEYGYDTTLIVYGMCYSIIIINYIHYCL